jgi:hypothetical protein
MIQRETINGAPATVAYLTTDEKGSFVLVTPEKATLVKVIYDDGRVVFGTPAPEHGEKFYSEDQPRDDHGRWTSGGESKLSDRAQRALASHKPSTAEKQRWAEKNEAAVAKMLGGKTTDDNNPADVTAKSGGQLHGVEVKTLLDNKNDKITVHPESRARKEAWAKADGARLHTVVFDDRNRFGTSGHSGHRLYYREGVGAFRLAGMTPVRDAAHLRSLVAGGK